MPGLGPVFVSALDARNIPPQVSGLSHTPSLPTSAQQVTVSCRVRTLTVLTSVTLYTQFNGAGFTSQAMFDDGAHGDGAAGDSVWGFRIAPQADGTVVDYYVVALAGTLVDTSQTRSYTVSNTTGVPEGNIVINEINYNNAGTDTEWIELYNIGSTLEDLSGWGIYNHTGPTFNFPAGCMMAPGAYLVVCADTHAVAVRYGISNVIGNFTFSLLNSSPETIVLRRGDNSLVDSVTYGTSSPWPSVTSGNKTIEVIDPLSGNGDYRNWQGSYIPGGTPGGPNSVPTGAILPMPAPRPVVVLYPNPTEGPVMLGPGSAGREVEVYDLLGGTWGQIQADRTGRVDLRGMDGLQSGMYFLRSGRDTLGAILYLR